MKAIKIFLRRNNHKRRIFAAAVALILLFLGGCKDFSFFNELGVKGGISINPTSVSILAGGTMSFSASGGNGDYVFSVVSGSGTIDPVNGVYTAPGSEGTDIVIVTDSTNLSATATVSIVSILDELEINPKVATLSPGSSITFVATGGVEPYTFSFETNNSGGTITAAGVYTAGTVTGVTDTIIVMDADSMVSVPAASVSVVGAVTNVNYSITVDTFPGSAYTIESISGTFTITNSGTANGGKPISWWLYLSDDGTFGGEGETLIASNSTTELNSGFSSDVMPMGNWPAEGGPFTIFVMISAEDDMIHSDNIYNAGTISLNRPKVDYRVVQVQYTVGGETIPGEPLTGEFFYDNAGASALEDGILDLSWEVYASPDNSTLDPGDVKVASGTELSPLDAGDPEVGPIDFSGNWPLDGGDYYLIVKVTCEDDEQNTDDNIKASTVIPIGVYTESEPNDEWQNLPGTGGYNILAGMGPTDPIVLVPGMSIKIEGAEVSNVDRDDVFRFNTGSANMITFTVTWATDSDDIDIYVFREPGGFVVGQVIEVLGYAPNYLSGTITKGPADKQFTAGEDLWLDIYCHIPNGPLTTVPYTVIITVD